MRIVFFGTPRLAAAALTAIIEAGHEVCLVVTRADKPKGRGMTTGISEVKEVALRHNIPLYQPQTLKCDQAIETLTEAQADIFITAAYGRIFTKQILDIPPYGCINIHASLLPKLRGAAPIQRAVMNGDRVGGVTIMHMDEGIDTGDIAYTVKTDIPADINGGEYYELITKLGSLAIVEYLEQIKNNTAQRTPQDHSQATFAPKLEKADELISFDDDASAVYNKIRGLAPAPCGYMVIAEKRIKIHKAVVGTATAEVGEIVKADKNGIEIACKTGSIVITELQPEGKKIMTAQAFLAGNKILGG